MSGNSKVTIEIDVDFVDANAKMSDFERMVDNLASKWERVKATIKREGTKIMISLGGMIDFARNMLSSLNISIGNVGDGLLHIVEAIISTLLVTYTSYQSLGLTNPIFLLSAGIAYLALMSAIGVGRDIMHGVEGAKSAAAEAQRMMGNVRTILTPWG